MVEGKKELSKRTIYHCRPPKKYKVIPHRRPLVIGHSPVVGRIPIPKQRYNNIHGTRRGPLISGPVPNQGRLNSHRVVSQIKNDRVRGGNSITNQLKRPNNPAIRFDGTGSRRHNFDQDIRHNKRNRKNKRQRGPNSSNAEHPIDSYRRRKRRKQYKGISNIFEIR